jgi:hypothetical protein
MMQKFYREPQPSLNWFKARNRMIVKFNFVAAEHTEDQKAFVAAVDKQRNQLLEISATATIPEKKNRIVLVSGPTTPAAPPSSSSSSATPPSSLPLPPPPPPPPPPLSSFCPGPKGPALLVPGERLLFSSFSKSNGAVVPPSSSTSSSSSSASSQAVPARSPLTQPPHPPPATSKGPKYQEFETWNNEQLKKVLQHWKLTERKLQQSVATQNDHQATPIHQRDAAWNEITQEQDKIIKRLTDSEAESRKNFRNQQKQYFIMNFQKKV